MRILEPICLRFKRKSVLIFFVMFVSCGNSTVASYVKLRVRNWSFNGWWCRIDASRWCRCLSLCVELSVDTICGWFTTVVVIWCGLQRGERYHRETTQVRCFWFFYESVLSIISRFRSEPSSSDFFCYKLWFKTLY